MNKHTKQEPVWCFRRWSRKPWSAFAGLCRLKIGVLAVSMSIILLATQIAGAQTVGADSLARYRTMHLDSVQVRGVRSAVATTRIIVPQSTFLVDQKQIASFATAEAVLRLLPEVDVRERGGRSVQTDIAIRGGSFDQTMVMLNGIDFSDARTGHQSHALPVDIDDISAISVVDVTAHPGALAGAINFQTDPLARRFLRAHAAMGAFDYGYANLSGAWTAEGAKLGSNAGAKDRLTLFGSGSYRRSGGYRENTDFWNANAYGRVIYHGVKAGFFDIQGGFQRRDWGSNGFYSLAYPLQFEKTMTGLASVRWNKTWGRFTLSATGSFRQNNDEFHMVRGSARPNRHTTYNGFGELYGTYDFGRGGQTSLGVNYTRHQLFSTAMGDALASPSHPVPGLSKRDGSGRDSLYSKGSSRGTLGVWAGHYVDLGPVWMHAIGSAVHTPYGTDGTFGAAVGWNVTRNFDFIAGASRSMRLPTFTELYYNGGAIYHPNRNLKPETAMIYRLTAAVTAGNWLVTASGHYRRTRNVIDWEQRPGPDPADPSKTVGHWWSTQLNRLGTAGAELSVRYSTKGWLRVATLNYGYTHSEMTVASGYISKYALDYMRHKVSAVVGVAFLKGFVFTLTGSFYDRVGSYLDVNGARQSYKPYFLLDGRLSWERGPVQLYIDATNMTNTRYADFGGLTMPGVWVTGGVVVTLK